MAILCRISSSLIFVSPSAPQSEGTSLMCGTLNLGWPQWIISAFPFHINFFSTYQGSHNNNMSILLCGKTPTLCFVTLDLWVILLSNLFKALWCLLSPTGFSFLSISLSVAFLCCYQRLNCPLSSLSTSYITLPVPSLAKYILALYLRQS